MLVRREREFSRRDRRLLELLVDLLDKPDEAQLAKQLLAARDTPDVSRSPSSKD